MYIVYICMICIYIYTARVFTYIHAYIYIYMHMCVWMCLIVFAHPSVRRILSSLRKTSHLCGWWCRAHRHDLQLALAANGCAVEERQHRSQDHDPNLGKPPSRPADLPALKTPMKSEECIKSCIKM